MYADKALRCGIRMNDLHDCRAFKAALQPLAQEKLRVILDVFRVPRETFEEWMRAPDQQNGAWLADGGFNVDAIVDSYCGWAAKLLPHVADSRALLHQALAAGRKILLEGAQGLLLDIDCGTYPYVTSSNCGAGGFSTGAGIPPNAINRVYNVMSAYMTRVGSGPFPTELGTEAETASEHVDRRMKPADAAALARTAKDDYSLGKVIRHIAGEFGTTTGRPRRTGWFDAVAYRMAVRINGPDAIISKLDVLDAMPVLKICTAYRYTGPATRHYGAELAPGAVLTEFPADARILVHCVPATFVEYRGWLEDTTKCISWNKLPAGARTYLAGIGDHTGCRVRMASIGPQRNQTLMAP